MTQDKELCFLWDNTIHGAIPAFEKFEAAFAFEKVFEHPYCPEEVDLKAYIFKAERGSKADFRILVRGLSARLRNGREILISTLENGLENPLFRPGAGEYRYYVTLLDKKRHRSYRYPEKGELSFTVTPSDRKGFLRVSARDPAYLEFFRRQPLFRHWT